MSCHHRIKGNQTCGTDCNLPGFKYLTENQSTSCDWETWCCVGSPDMAWDRTHTLDASKSRDGDCTGRLPVAAGFPSFELFPTGTCCGEQSSHSAEDAHSPALADSQLNC
ncbi:uncharacterized protein LOC144609541 [Rhinoraja longicauda]